MVVDSAAAGRCIYLREPLDTVRKVMFTADLKPMFHEVSVQPPVQSHLPLKKRLKPDMLQPLLCGKCPTICGSH